jgi:hypothetical protein
MDTQQLPPPIALYQLATGHYVSQAIYVAAKLGIADFLADGPLGHAELARHTGTHAASLRRVLRLLASVGVFAETDDGSFALTQVGSCLKSGPGSFRAVARLFAGPGTWLSWGDLLETVRTGEPALARVFKSDPFEYFAMHPEEGAVFDEAMGAFTAMTAVAVAAAYDCSQFGTMIDVGGGAGALLIGILRETPNLRGIVFDLARVAASAQQHIADANLSARCEFVAGDFFQSVPSGGDAYLLKHVIHDWDDEKAAAILRSCRRAMDRAAKLLIVEGIYPQRIDASLESRGAAANDVNMLVCTGGRQRSEAEFRALFDAAGFKLTNMVPTMARAHVIEGMPA